MELTGIQFVLVVLIFWGFGLSVGRYFPAAPEPRSSLATRINSICENYQPLQDSPLCQTIFAASFKDDDWLETSSGRISQEDLDAEFINFVSFSIPAPDDISLSLSTPPHQNSYCTPQSRPDMKDTCNPNTIYSNNSTRVVIESRYTAARRSTIPPSQSTPAYLFTLFTTLTTWLWKWGLFTLVGACMSLLVSTRWLFWLWVGFPWIWFIRLASPNTVLIWYALASFAITDLQQGFKYPISRAWLILGMCVAFAAILGWQWMRSNREIQVAIFVALAVTVPLEPVWDYYFPTLLEGFRRGQEQGQQQQSVGGLS